MRCRDVLRRSTAYLDGELDERRSSAVRGHLRTCASCAAHFEQERALVDAAEQLEPIDPPASLWAAIDARLADEEVADARRSRLWWWWQGARRPLVIGISAAAAAALIVAVLSEQRAQQRAERATGGRATGLAVAADRAGESPELRPAPESLSDGAEPVPGCAEAVTLDDQWACEIARSDRRYRDSLRELREVVDEMSAELPEAQRSEVAARLSGLDGEIARRRQEVALIGEREGRGPEQYDELFASYRSAIHYMEDVTLSAGRGL